MLLLLFMLLLLVVGGAKPRHADAIGGHSGALCGTSAANRTRQCRAGGKCRHNHGMEHHVVMKTEGGWAGACESIIYVKQGDRRNGDGEL